MVVSSVPIIRELLAEAAGGRLFIIADSEDPDSEGALIVAAQFADAATINFMAKHGRGLICLGLTSKRAADLDLALVPNDQHDGRGRAFTVSIEAKEGVSTGISAHDRARTVSVAIDERMTKHDIVSPGHVFPIVARDGGVLVRTGHTEAGVDIARLAGLNPAAVICDVLNDDGAMARLSELEALAAKHALKIASIADLISYRARSERLVTKILERPFESRHGGTFTLSVFRHQLDNTEHVALVKGTPSLATPTLVRMHRVDIAADLLGRTSGPSGLAEKALMQIAAYDGPGAAVFIHDTSPQSLSRRYGTIEHDAAEQFALRDYGIGAQILLSLGVHDMILLTTSTARLVALEGYNLRIVGRRPL